MHKFCIQKASKKRMTLRTRMFKDPDPSKKKEKGGSLSFVGVGRARDCPENNKKKSIEIENVTLVMSMLFQKDVKQ